MATVPILKPFQKLLLKRMGSFTSTPKIDNPDSADDELLATFHPCTKDNLLSRCIMETTLSGRPPLIERTMKLFKNRNKSHTLRLLQWNILSQCLGTSNDNFVKCPRDALDWSSRRFLILQEILQHDPDIICLQEVDHFTFLETALGSVGYSGVFYPKPDSPCVYLEGNNGPDGCAIFYKLTRLELLNTQTRILEVWRVQSNQVAINCVLRDIHTNKEWCVATTHLKARKGALLAALRENQGRDLIEWVHQCAAGRPIVLAGDFNAEPSEPVYRTITENDKPRLRMRSAYCANPSDVTTNVSEPPFTTWKVRETGEVCHTIDYIFHSKDIEVNGLLRFPTGEELGEERAPCAKYPSDHFSLIADLSLVDPIEK